MQGEKEGGRGSRRRGSGGRRVSLVNGVLDAIETLAGVGIRFLDVSGQPCTISDGGELTPVSGEQAVLSAHILELAIREGKPILGEAGEAGMAVALPFFYEGRLAGFIEAACFTIEGLADDRVRQLDERFIVETLHQLPPARVGCVPLSFERFSALVDLLETAAGELTFLAALPKQARMSREAPGETRSLPWRVSQLMEVLNADSGGQKALSEAVEARERLEALYDSSQYGMLLLDSGMKIVEANRVFGELFNTDPEAFIGVSGEWLRRWVVKHAADPARVAEEIGRLFSDPEAVMDDDLELISPRHMILRCFSSPTRNKAGKSVGRAFMFRDITEFRQARMQMMGAEKMMAIGRVAAGLAHGLNNILAGVVTYADFALEEGNSDKIRDALRMSIAAAERASELVNKLLVVSGESESMRQDVDLHVELERLLDSMADDFKAHGISLVRRLDPVAHVNVDPVQMSEAFRHILENSAQALGSNGTITVRTKTDWDVSKVYVIISDTGPGFPDGLKDRIFDPFFTTRGVVSGGTDTAAVGLGLSITKGIVDKHGGRITLANLQPHGARVTVELPLGGHSQEPPHPSLY